jgi:ankyrin repeat protein
MAADALWSAVILADLAAIRTALAAGADINQRDQFGDTALNLAAAHGCDAVVITLIGASAALESAGDAGETSLMIAVRAGHLGAARMLVAGGARVDDDLVTNVAARVGQLEESTDLDPEQAEVAEAWRDFLRRLWRACAPPEYPAPNSLNRGRRG